ncbi:MAG: hypothetical protein ABSD74_11720 [Rhizomicrobium sp.]|jgi:hypothetical protein
MPEFRVSDATFSRLKKHAEPLVDNSDSLLNRILDVYEQNASPPRRPSTQITDSPRVFSVSSPPNLLHTKVLSAKINGVALSKPNWNKLLVELVRRAKGKLSIPADAKKFVIVNFVRGKKEDEGYRYVPEIGISVQGQDSNSAWRGASHLAQQLGIPVEVEFMWRMKEGALHPGLIGILRG